MFLLHEIPLYAHNYWVSRGLHISLVIEGCHVLPKPNVVPKPNLYKLKRKTLGTNGKKSSKLNHPF